MFKTRIGKKILCLLLICCMLLTLLPVTASAAPSITAPSGIVIDFETGDILYAKDIDTLRAPSSMTKIMTAFIVYEEIAAGNITFNTMVPICATAEEISRNNDRNRILRAGNSYSVETLLRLIMLPSHNGACFAVAEFISGDVVAFVMRMNVTARRLGMRGQFGDPMGGLAATQLSARDVATLTREFIRTHPDSLRITSMISTTFNGIPTPNTNRFLHPNRNHWDDADFFPCVDGFKTGTGPAGANLSATAIRNGRRVISVVMHSTSGANRYRDSRAIIEHGFAELARRDNAMNAIQLNVTSNQNPVRRNTYYTLTANLTNVNTGNFTALGGDWIINGQTVATFGPFTPNTQRTFSLPPQLLPYNSPLNTLQVEFFINLPGGGRRAATLQLPVSAEAPLLFRDINPHWARWYIYGANSLGLVQGYQGLFMPANPLTRAEAVQMLHNLAGAPAFADVTDGWYADAVNWAAGLGIVRGDDYGLFRPNNSITRQDFFTILRNFAELWLNIDTSVDPAFELPFHDRDLIGFWAEDAIRWAHSVNLARGNNYGGIAPLDITLRAEAAALLYRFASQIM